MIKKKKNMKSDISDEHRKSRHRIVMVRSISILLVLFFLQGGVAYGTLQLFLALPADWTGIIDDADIERDAHQGTVYMIDQAIKSEPAKTPSQVLEKLQPHFHFRLAYIERPTKFTDDVQEQLDRYNFAYDDEDDHIYAKLQSGGYLKLGPLVTTDINDANASAIFILLALLTIVNALLFFAILYFAFSNLWREARAIRLTANQLGEGELTARVPRIRSEPLKMIGHVINDMATRLELLVGHSRTMMHAMAHEFRTPLARLRFALSMLEDSRPQEKTKLYAGIDKDINELEQLIKISLDYFRMNNKNMPTKLETVHIKRWAENIIDDLSLLKPKGFEVSYDIANVDGSIDRELAAMAFRNLVLNAFKYARSKVHIHIYKQDDGLIFEFDDDGPGIAENAREEIFSPFFRLDSDKYGSHEGYGVGLAFVRAIAELHHGSAFVLSSRLGGARFVMRLGI
ncbi:ATP-binding protein [uncultured Bartonella sp.]|uniref:ATP-binding protein n=1 Tax=uncultured Bartonella sp. TaxID=104108 RepID=UPI0026241FCE|nr:ATP-binding protein [uncultured Bartonella sp.]